MEVIRCSKEYIEKTADMYDGVVFDLEKNINYPKWTYKQYPCIDDVKRTVDNNTLFICIDNDEVLGAMVINQQPDGCYEKAKWSKDLKLEEYIIVHMLAVDINHNGQGIGKFMLNWAKQYGKDNGYKAIRLDIVPDNIPAINLYKSVGFKYADTLDLERNIKEIPEFVVYELNL